MSVNQYDARFTQLLRYAVGLICKEAEGMERFVRGLRTEIGSKLILFQLQIYIQAVEKALEVQRDILEEQEVRNKESLITKRARYHETPNSRVPNFRFNRNTGSSIVPASRYNRSLWYRGGFTQVLPSARPNLTGNPWCSRYNQNHASNCVQGK